MHYNSKTHLTSVLKADSRGNLQAGEENHNNPTEWTYWCNWAIQPKWNFLNLKYVNKWFEMIHVFHFDLLVKL